MKLPIGAVCFGTWHEPGSCQGPPGCMQKDIRHWAYTPAMGTERRMLLQLAIDDKLPATMLLLGYDGGGFFPITKDDVRWDTGPLTPTKR